MAHMDEETNLKKPEIIKLKKTHSLKLKLRLFSQQLKDVLTQL